MATTETKPAPIAPPHEDWCPKNTTRVERTEHTAEQVVTIHCVDCGAHTATDLDGKKLAAPTGVGPFANQQQGAAWTSVSMQIPGGGR